LVLLKGQTQPLGRLGEDRKRIVRNPTGIQDSAATVRPYSIECQPRRR